MHFTFFVAFFLSVTTYTTTSTPLACQPNSLAPMQPIFHIIGNVTQSTDGSITIESINDASGVTFYEGLYHVWHQCCQNHWDHVISKDLIHWQRLPPPIQPVTLKTWDGSISLLPASEGGPVILYDAQDGMVVGSHGERPPSRGFGDKPIIGIARLVDPNDKYLMTWPRDSHNPVNFTGKPTDFPGQIWKNGDHWNFLGDGDLYSTQDPTFRSWTNKGRFVGINDHSGQWWINTPNQIDGTPPPADVPNRVVNIGGGATYLFGAYDASNETFTPWSPNAESPGVIAKLENSHADWWGGQGGADNNNRMMIIGWAMPDFHSQGPAPSSALTRLTLLREVNYDVKSQNLVSNPVPELVGLRGSIVGTETNIPLSKTPHEVAHTSGGNAASADIEITFSGFATGDIVGACVLSASDFSGIGINIIIGTSNASVRIGPCNNTVATTRTRTTTMLNDDADINTFPLLGDTSISLRILPDRSVADFFVQGGRYAGTSAWLHALVPRLAVDSSVLLFANNGNGIQADVTVWAMGCGWLDPSYTENPNL